MRLAPVVLVVDDEPMMRWLMIAALVTDVRMPRLHGLALTLEPTSCS